ncbi:MAG: FAD-dependent oxidoreductase [Phycisphaeraceae bacterium]|nr:FAD-dependent oxidoreductase [Phycisphaeraceae bacterium]
MISVDDLSKIPILAPIPQDALDEAAELSADIHLRVGEYVVHEGEPPALFVVLAGHLEITKLLDGVERVVTQRVRGEIYGEVPVIYGTQFQTSGRAAEPSRILRIDMAQYYSLAATAPGFASAVGGLALARIEGLQSLVAERPRAQATVIGDRQDPAVAEARRFLSRNQVTFETIEADATALPSWLDPALLRSGHLPAVRLQNGAVLTRPTMRELAGRLGLSTTPSRSNYDVVIVGAGPAGLAAATYAASEGLVTLVVEREAPGGQAGSSSRIENYLGFPGGISGDDLAMRAFRQAKRLGAEIIVTREVARLDPSARTVVLDGGDVLEARTVILSTGLSWRVLDIPGLDRLTGKGAYYGASRSDAAMTQGRDVHLVGAGNSAGQAALFLANHARTVTLVARTDDIGTGMSRYLVEQVRSKDNIVVLEGAEIAGLHGDSHLTSIDIARKAHGPVERVETGGLFFFVGAQARTDWLPPEIARDARGFVLTGVDVARSGRWPLRRDPYLVETSVPGIFACGDVRLGQVKRVATAVGEGSIAVAFVHQFLALHREAI